MSRYSPEVTPTGVSPLGALLRSGSQSYLQGREQRRKERLREQREERLQEYYDMRQRQNEIEMARQGYRPEGATEPASIEEASRPQPGDPSTPTQGGFRSAADQIPEDASNLSEALRTARGERETGPFTPGDIREGMIPPAVAMEMERMPGRVSLPSGGSISETPPEVQRQRRERSELSRLLQRGGWSEPRAEVAARTGSDILRPEETEPMPPVPTAEQLRAAGATPKEIRAVEGDPEAMRSLRDDLVGRRTSGDQPEPMETDQGNAAFNYFRQNPDADLGEAAGIFPFNEAQLAGIREEARDAEETLSAGTDAVAESMDIEPQNETERRVLREIAGYGSMRQWERAMGEENTKIAESNLSEEEKRRELRRISRLWGAYQDMFRRSRFSAQGGGGPKTFGEALQMEVRGGDTPPEPY